MTDRSTLPTLDYAPLRYRHRSSSTAAAGALTAGAGLVVALIRWHGPAVPVWGQGLIVGVPLALAVLTCLPGMAAECRVEATSLWFRSANARPVSVPIDDVVAVDRIDGAGDWHHYELVVRGRGRMVVGAEVLEPIAPLMAALRRENPGIRFGAHSGVHCRACGVALWPGGRVPTLADGVRLARRGACPACGQALPKSGRFVPDARSA